MAKKQTEYNKRWEEKNRERRRYLNYRNASRTFLRSYAQFEDLDELEELIEARKKALRA